METWKPIASAPKNGKHFIAWDGKNVYAGNMPRGCCFGNWTKVGKEWDGSMTCYNPTHWLPLPEPPKG